MASEIVRWGVVYLLLFLLSKLPLCIGSITFYANVSNASPETLRAFVCQTSPLVRKMCEVGEIPQLSKRGHKGGWLLCVVGVWFSLVVILNALLQILQNPSVAKAVITGSFIVIEVATLIHFGAVGRKLIAIEQQQHGS